jgi:hypothetical protein
MKANTFVMETPKHERKEEKNYVVLKDHVKALEKELKKHESKPMNKAHPKS